MLARVLLLPSDRKQEGWANKKDEGYDVYDESEAVCCLVDLKVVYCLTWVVWLAVHAEMDQAGLVVWDHQSKVRGCDVHGCGDGDDDA